MSSPKIGIPVELSDGKIPPSLGDYESAVERAGGTPIHLLLTNDRSHMTQMLSSVDALLLRGGGDIPPQRYGQEPHPETQRNLMSDARDAFDFAIIQLAHQLQLPTLGICLGCQELNVFRGGSLHQHIPDLPASLKHSCEKTCLDAHPVSITAGTLLHKILNLTTLSTNSRHHQAIDKLGQNLGLAATAPDGIIEAVEDPTLPFFVAVQWHPENLANSAHEKLFSALVQAAAAQCR